MNREMTTFIYNKAAVVKSLKLALDRRKKRLNDKVATAKEKLKKRRRYFFFGPKITDEDADAIIHGERYQWFCNSSIFETMYDEIKCRDNYDEDIAYISQLITAAEAANGVTIALSAHDFSLIKDFY